MTLDDLTHIFSEQLDDALDECLHFFVEEHGGHYEISVPKKDMESLIPAVEQWRWTGYSASGQPIFSNTPDQ